MPLKDNISKGELYFGTDNGLIKVASTIQEIPHQYTEQEVKDIFNVPCSIELNIKEISTEDMLIIFGVCTRKHLNTNNWRKNHGMPMKRGTRKNDSKTA